MTLENTIFNCWNSYIPAPLPNFGAHKFVVAAVACIFVAKVDVVAAAAEAKIAELEVEAMEEKDMGLHI